MASRHCRLYFFSNYCPSVAEAYTLQVFPLGLSELNWERTEKVKDVCKPGDAMKVKLIKVDDTGRLDFSRKALMEKPEGYKPPPPRDSNWKRNKGGSDGKPFRKKRF